MKDPVISVRDFRKTYGDFVAVDGISFEARRGEIAAYWVAQKTLPATRLSPRV